MKWMRRNVFCSDFSLWHRSIKVWAAKSELCVCQKRNNWNYFFSLSLNGFSIPLNVPFSKSKTISIQKHFPQQKLLMLVLSLAINEMNNPTFIKFFCGRFYQKCFDIFSPSCAIFLFYANCKIWRDGMSL